MKMPAFLALVATSLVAVACSSSSQGGSSETPPPTATVPAEPAPTPATDAPKPEDKPAEEPKADAPPPGATEPPAGGGRLAFTACTPESRQAKGCTKDLRPVCGQVDTGVRCIKAPCPSAEPRTFPNACTACLEAKVTGYFPMSCEDINSGRAP
ncbi:hypothetical protein [Polyangium aurulentum]|uniref:hypothetical protein n=1 Tax=Polyangium aurulentum TaxID=2567896 RepID=UPI0010ADE51D|nr:hypothetical protein [Polyangium aurulentum]UQA63352.1 hypothetical protein E8A73_023945 [Polyangium aurulentum]